MATAIDYLQRPIALLADDKLEAKRGMMWGHFRRFGALLGRSETANPDGQQGPDEPPTRSCTDRRSSRRAVAGLPRPGTFKRQESERREKLVRADCGPSDRRTASGERRRSASARGADTSMSRPPPALPTSVSAPEPSQASEPQPCDPAPAAGSAKEESLTRTTTAASEPVGVIEAAPPPPDEAPPPFSNVDGYSDAGIVSDGINEDMLNEELERRWILNLSMFFRDRSDREKFFVTFAATPNRWRRVTVSCDYRNAPPDSLEQDLKALRYQRDKNSRIYESIRESLPDIQFYDTVTNLKLQTTDGRLHIHVTQDVNEIIPYPPVSAISHLPCPRYRESQLEFDAHMSGYVYRVVADGQIFIKKEIPGPDSVDEFLYEINALNCLRHSASVIRFGGVIVDDAETHVKGLLISFAEQGALVDLLYDEKGRLPWQRRERWAQQTVQGLSEIHEGGFVQGDFTLSNIVIDGNDDAKIIDINRRGCPVGWEPPEVSALIESNQRISMYIGVKSDLFQLGMVLWALAQEQDEPEVQPRPLTLKGAGDEVPQYFRDIVEICLSDRPQGRLSAKELLGRFPEIEPARPRPAIEPRPEGPSPSEKQYIDPCDAVEREDLDRFRQLQPVGQEASVEPQPSSQEATYVNAAQSSDTGYGSSGTYVIPRGRTGAHRRSMDGATPTTAVAPGAEGGSVGPLSRDADASRPMRLEPYGLERFTAEPDNYNENPDEDELEPQIVAVSPKGGQWEEVRVEGHPYLIHTSSFEVRGGALDLRTDEDVEVHSEPARVEDVGSGLIAQGGTPGRETDPISKASHGHDGSGLHSRPEEQAVLSTRPARVDEATSPSLANGSPTGKVSGEEREDLARDAPPSQVSTSRLTNGCSEENVSVDERGAPAGGIPGAEGVTSPPLTNGSSGGGIPSGDNGDQAGDIARVELGNPLGQSALVPGG
ncbi:MAG: hypothetical protein M1832_004528 [Thelocarpon impressellum]|nr:MAG: hypothetical protein M1832_004528 [Thelocarpon impressellum]